MLINVLFLPGDTVVVAGFGASVFAFPNDEMPNPWIGCTFNHPTITTDNTATVCEIFAYTADRVRSVELHNMIRVRWHT